jgi:hypothetical protein
VNVGRWIQYHLLLAVQPAFEFNATAQIAENLHRPEVNFIVVNDFNAPRLMAQAGAKETKSPERPGLFS